MKQLFQAINHCHAQDILHSDIKPEKIMITDDDVVHLIGFDTKKGSGSGGPGTASYMAPESIPENEDKILFIREVIEM